jgi:predicted RNA-binding Zn ribbon-like protein
MLALALVNTEADGDVLATPAELIGWLSKHVGPVDDEVALRLSDFRALRAAIREAVSAELGDGSPPAEAVRALNEASAAVPTSPALESGPSGAVRVERATASPSQTVQILAAVARSAIELFGPDRERLRRCPATRCGKVFVASRGRQVWCSASCGNRMRVARHHARRVAGG